MTILSGALGVLSRKVEPKTAHSLFIESQLLPVVAKVQKEIGWRRYKDCQAPLQEAVLVLKAFQHEEWPSTLHSPSTTAINQANAVRAAEEAARQYSTHGKSGAKKSTENDGKTVAPDEDDQATVDAQETEEASSVAKTDAVADGRNDTTPTNGSEAVITTDESIAAGKVKAHSPERTHNSVLTPSEDDPQTCEPVHKAILTTLEAFMLVLQDTAKLPRPSELALEGITLIVANRYLSGRAGGPHEGSGPTMLTRLLESAVKPLESANDTVQAALIVALTTIMNSPKCAIHENSMLSAFRGLFHVYLVTKASACKASAKRALLDMLKSVLYRMEAHDAVIRNAACCSSNKSVSTDVLSITSGDSTSDIPGVQASKEIAPPTFASQYHTDAYFLIRCLCKLSSKELPADTTDETALKAKHAGLMLFSHIPTDPTDLNSKILALDLILVAMESCGEGFTNSSKFVYLIQNYLCGSLLKNCVSNHTQVAFLSQKIFLVLVSKFKVHLKQDIEVFMSNVFFRVLDSQNSSFKQKALVLESLRSLCKDPVLLTQVFLSYDCDFNAMNLYKDIVHMLTKLGGKATSTPSSVVSKRDTDQEFELSLAAIECLVTILKAFLRALGLPAGEDNDNDTAGARIRGMLQLDSALATPDDAITGVKDDGDSVADETNSVSGMSTHSSHLALDSIGGSDVAVQIVDAFDRKRHAEQNFEIGAVKFTLSLKTGLSFFIDNGFVDLDAKRIAHFFLANKDKLDKTQMGEALGREPDAGFSKVKDLDAEKGGPGFWVRILHHYADALDFTGIVFDEAIRLFLSGFRLPGEAQKIDRIMEKFAERYTSQNPAVFPSSDTAFILAFSVIMLNTDLHNPSIKPEKRMTLDSFLRNNKGIGENGSDLPADVLKGIFERIKERPFSLKEDDAARERVGTQKQIFDTSIFFEGAALFGNSADDRKRENFKKERDEMMAVTEQLIRRRPEMKNAGIAGNDSKLTHDIAPADVVKPMFDVTWGPMLGILSQVLECADDERSVAVCLNGFVFAIRLAAHGRMSLARDTFVSSLAKFTFLGSLKEMKRKNVESIRTLLSVAVIDGEYLGESWGPVLRCMSQLVRLRLSASGLDADDTFLTTESSRQSSSRQDVSKGSGAIFRQYTPGELAREAEESNGKAVLEAVQEVLIDKVFSSTVSLSSQSLAHFVQQLIVEARSEVSGNSKGSESSKLATDKAKNFNGSSIFSLQRLVDVADYNMDVRPRLVWAQVWELMADFFAGLACHDNRMVSIFAIDSLKQLSLKFLEKQELAEFNFQCSFLKPFLSVMEDKNSREDIRELVLQCIDNIVKAKSQNLKSGWKTVFSILTLSAGDSSEKIEFLGLSILQRLLDEHLDDIGSLADKAVAISTSEELSSLDKRNRNANADDFVSLCKSSSSFVQLQDTDSLRPFALTMRAFCHTAIYADLLAGQRVLPPVSGAQTVDRNAAGFTYSFLSKKESLDLVLWRPIFEGLADGIRSSAKTSGSGVGCLVQRGSILSFRAILLRHGHLFSTPQLRAILSDTYLPAIQFAAESDVTPVVDIASESPSISNIDFLATSPPLPPQHDDPSLRQFAELNTVPKRPVGPAELMLEASFTDLRHGGDGDLRKAYKLAKKSLDDVSPSEQPFPDSWLATTAPLAMGLLTDVFSEFVIYRGEEGRAVLWPLIKTQLKLWCVGRHGISANGMNGNGTESSSWFPCEALIRIGAREIFRLSSRVFNDSGSRDVSSSEQMTWSSLILELFSDIITMSTQIEDAARENLLSSKKKQSIMDRKQLEMDIDDLSLDEKVVVTPYGRGRCIRERQASYTYQSGEIITIQAIKLQFGGILYQPDIETSITRSSAEIVHAGIPSEVNVPVAYWVHIVPTLKIRCIAAHCLQQSLIALLENLVPLANQSDVQTILDALYRSRSVAASAVKDEDIATAFQEALLKDWGDGIHVPNEDTETTARLSLLHGSACFFLAQEAGATKAIFNLLSMIYLSTGLNPDWDRASFAEDPLISVATEVLGDFLASEEKDGHLIDHNSWRTVNESGGKIALYCTLFASVTIDILKTIRSMQYTQFDKYKHELFPKLCALVRVQSDDIRGIVCDILERHVGRFMGSNIAIRDHQ